MAFRKTGNYSLGNHLDGKSQHIRDAFSIIEKGIKDLDSQFLINVGRDYIGFMKARKNIVQIFIEDEKILIQLLRIMPHDIHDPLNKLRYVKNSMQYFSKHISELDVYSRNEADYAVKLIKSLYSKVKNEVRGW